MGTLKNHPSEAVVLTSTHSLYFGAKLRKKLYPSKPQFYYINVGCKGVFVTRTCFHDENAPFSYPFTYMSNLSFSYLLGFPVMIFQSPFLRAARLVVLNETLGKGTPAGLYNGSMLWRISVRGLADFLLKTNKNDTIVILNTKSIPEKCF